jgi:hypothetical protein
MEEFYIGMMEGFRYIQQPVVVIEDGKEIFHNSAVNDMFRLFPEKLDVEESFGELIDNTSEKAAGLVYVAGKPMSAFATKMGKRTVISLGDGGSAGNPTIADSVAVGLKDALSVCQMSADVLNNRTEPLEVEKTVQYAQMLRRSVRRMNRVIENARFISEDPKNPTYGENFNAVEIIEDTVSMSDYLLRGKGAMITWQTTDDYIEYLGNKEMLERMMLNTISNAVKYTPVTGKIKISITTDKKKIRIAVRDNGCGVAYNVVSCVFEKYKHPDLCDGRAGAGMGLAVAQTVARRHGGNIILESYPTGGTTVQIVLPFQNPVIENVKEAKHTMYGSGSAMFLTELSDVLSLDNYSDDGLAE